jgi:hypothetical protein
MAGASKELGLTELSAAEAACRIVRAAAAADTIMVAGRAVVARFCCINWLFVPSPGPFLTFHVLLSWECAVMCRPHCAPINDDPFEAESSERARRGALAKTNRPQLLDHVVDLGGAPP